MIAHRFKLLLLLGAVALVWGCEKSGKGLLGYGTGELYDSSYRTVSVPIFENRSFERGVEFDLSEALIKEIELRTPYKVTTSDRADTMLTGTVTSVTRNVLSRTTDGGIPQEVQVAVAVSFEWKDLRTSQVIRKRSSIIGTGEHIPARTLSEPYERAQHEAVAELARDIVSVMRDDW